jgi:hypothetical protein
MTVTAGTFLVMTRAPEHDGYAAVLLPAFLVAGFAFAAAFVPLTAQGMTGVRDGILLLGALSAFRMLPAGATG